jgi:hypothetical protein
MITCPYCGSCFDNKTYQTQHVPCPEPHGDINPDAARGAEQ